MEFVTFAHERHYHKAQRRAVKRKSNLPAFTLDEMIVVAGHCSRMFSGKDYLIRGICHGAKNGLERRRLLELMDRNCEIVCTDLFPGEDVLQWDFRHQRDEWIGAFDFLYSNSLDHARNPWDCLRVWLAQLKLNGRIYIQWTPAHLTVQGGDCFGASLNEYIAVIDEVGEVEDLLYCGRSIVILVAKRADEQH